VKRGKKHKQLPGEKREKHRPPTTQQGLVPSKYHLYLFSARGGTELSGKVTDRHRRSGIQEVVKNQRKSRGSPKDAHPQVVRGGRRKVNHIRERRKTCRDEGRVRNNSAKRA